MSTRLRHGGIPFPDNFHMLGLTDHEFVGNIALRGGDTLGLIAALSASASRQPGRFAKTAKPKESR